LLRSNFLLSQVAQSLGRANLFSAQKAAICRGQTASEMNFSRALTGERKPSLVYWERTCCFAFYNWLSTRNYSRPGCSRVPRVVQRRPRCTEPPPLCSAHYLERNTQLAHTYWRSVLEPGDMVLDATCGNGHDTLALAEYIGAPVTGTLIALDIQDKAVMRTRNRLVDMFQSRFRSTELHIHSEYTQGRLRCRLWTENGFICELRQFPHEQFQRDMLDSWLADVKARPTWFKVAAYNLGYLPGLDSDRSIRTRADTTIKSLKLLEGLIAPREGIISVSCYTGHDGGAAEEAAVMDWAQALDASQWTAVAHRWLNRRQAPSLVVALHQVASRPSTPYETTSDKH